MVGFFCSRPPWKNTNCLFNSNCSSGFSLMEGSERMLLCSDEAATQTWKLGVRVAVWFWSFERLLHLLQNGYVTFTLGTFIFESGLMLYPQSWANQVRVLLIGQKCWSFGIAQWTAFWLRTQQPEVWFSAFPRILLLTLLRFFDVTA